MTNDAPSMRILVVDDDQTFRERLARALRDRGHEVVTAADRDGARLAAKAPLGAAIVDLRLGCDNGFDVLADLRCAWPAARLAIATGPRGDIEHDLIGSGASRVLRKPFDADDVVAFLASADEQT